MLNRDAEPNIDELQDLEPPFSAYDGWDVKSGLAARGIPADQSVIDQELLTASDATDCAEACIADDYCDVAAWLGASVNYPADHNCILKDLRGSTDPHYTKLPYVWMLVPQSAPSSPRLLQSRSPQIHIYARRCHKQRPLFWSSTQRLTRAKLQAPSLERLTAQCAGSSGSQDSIKPPPRASGTESHQKFV